MPRPPGSPGDDLFDNDGDFIGYQEFKVNTTTSKMPSEAPSLSELLVCRVMESAPHLQARRLRRGLQQAKWNGTLWQLQDIPTERAGTHEPDQDERHGDLPHNFFSTCDSEYLEVSFSVDTDRFLSDPHRAFQAGLRKGRKEVSVKNLTKDEREKIDVGKAKEISQWRKYKVVRAVPRSDAKGLVLLQMR